MAGRKAGEPRSDSTAHAKRRGLGGPEPVLAEKPGRPPWVPTEQQAEQIKSLAARGVGHREIAHLIGVDSETLRIRGADLLEAGRAIGISTITGVLFKEAQKGSYKHAALYLQHVAKWQQRQTVEHRGAVTLETLVTGYVPEQDSAAE